MEVVQMTNVTQSVLATIERMVERMSDREVIMELSESNFAIAMNNVQPRKKARELIVEQKWLNRS